MSALNIRDLSFMEELDSCESKIAGAASAGAAAAAGGGDAVAAGGATSNGTIYARADGGYEDSGYYGYYSSGPSASVDAFDSYYYY